MTGGKGGHGSIVMDADAVVTASEMITGGMISTSANTVFYLIRWWRWTIKNIPVDLITLRRR